MNYIKRHNKLIKLLEARSLDALLIRKKQNISYLTDTRGEDAILFVSARKNLLITDSRYKEEYRKSIENCELRIVRDKEVYACVEETSKKTRSKRIGFESNNFSYSEYADLKKRLKNKRLVPVKGSVESLRVVKDSEEIRRIREACRHGCEIINYGMRSVKPSISEEHLKNRIKEYIAKKGLKRADFEIIVASGKNASMPHAPVSDRKIERGEMVIIDLGAMNYGYNSDLTRTVFLGRIERKYRRIYNIVLDAQKKAFEKIKPGIHARYIDNIARRYISDRGSGRYFIHSLGHGVGLETHEKPRISRNSNDILQKNMTITIEPGIYIPGWGGVRIEDVALITQDGCEILTKGCRKKLCGQESIRLERV